MMAVRRVLRQTHHWNGVLKGSFHRQNDFVEFVRVTAYGPRRLTREEVAGDSRFAGPDIHLEGRQIPGPRHLKVATYLVTRIAVITFLWAAASPVVNSMA